MRKEKEKKFSNSFFDNSLSLKRGNHDRESVWISDIKHIILQL